MVKPSRTFRANKDEEEDEAGREIDFCKPKRSEDVVPNTMKSCRRYLLVEGQRDSLHRIRDYEYGLLLKLHRLSALSEILG